MKSTLLTLLIVALATPAFAQGRLREAAHHAATTESLTPQPKASQRSWVARHPILLGTLVGTGVGAAVGGLTCESPIAEGGSCDYYTDSSGARYLGMAYLGAWGAGIGALVGLAVKAAIR